MEFDGAQHGRRVRHPLQGGIAQIAWRQDTHRQARMHARLDRHKILEPRALMDVVRREVGVVVSPVMV